MNKLLSFIFLVIMLTANLVYAETIKSSKKIKSADTNQTISDEEFMKQWGQMEKDKKEAKADLEASKKRGKALDELINQYRIDK
ncbi:MAG: hypothetical protein PHH41_11060 [Sulfurimonas sp.]|nr:hypothetical protein [Sulfurimonas sp.]